MVTADVGVMKRKRALSDLAKPSEIKAAEPAEKKALASPTKNDCDMDAMGNRLHDSAVHLSLLDWLHMFPTGMQRLHVSQS